MQKYVKLHDDGTLEYAPQNKDGVSNWINDLEAVKRAGYLPLAEFIVPKNMQVAGYQVIDEQIEPVFQELPAPDYRELRRQAYPDIAEQLDLIYWDKVNGTDVWGETISQIKAQYPKPETQISEDENFAKTEAEDA